MQKSYDAFLVQVARFFDSEDELLDREPSCPHCSLEMSILCDADDIDSWGACLVYPSDRVSELRLNDLASDFWDGRWSCARCFLSLVWEELFCENVWASRIQFGSDGACMLYWLTGPAVESGLSRFPMILCANCCESDFIYSRNNEEGALVLAKSYTDAVARFEGGERLCLHCLSSAIDDLCCWKSVRICGRERTPCRRLEGGIVLQGGGSDEESA